MFQQVNAAYVTANDSFASMLEMNVAVYGLGAVYLKILPVDHL